MAFWPCASFIILRSDLHPLLYYGILIHGLPRGGRLTNPYQGADIMSNQSHEGKSYLYRLATVTACVLAGIICAKSFVLNPELYCGKSTVPAATTDYI